MTNKRITVAEWNALIERLEHAERILRGEEKAPKLWAEILRSGEHSVELGANYVQMLQGTPGNPPAGSSRLYSTGDANATIRDSAGSTTDLSGVATKEFFAIATITRDGGALIPEGNYPSLQLDGDLEKAFMSFHVPNDFTSITDAVIIVIAKITNAAVDWDIQSSYAASGQSNTTHTESDNTSTYNVTFGQFFEVDISGILSSLAAGDYVGVVLEQNNAAHNVGVLGVRFRYS